MSRFSRFLPLWAFALLALFTAISLNRATEQMPQHNMDPMIGMDLPSFSLKSMEGEALLTQQDLAEKTLILNYFASWCAACKAEYPILSDFATKYKLPVYGIAWKDDPNKLKYWLVDAGNIYQRTGLDEKGKLAIALGLKGVPETYVIHNSKIIAVYRGALSEDAVKNFLEPALKEINP